MAIEWMDPEKAAKARKAAAERRKRLVNTRGRAKSRRKPDEVRNQRDSIISFCTECITGYGLDVGGAGSVAEAINRCTAPECHLYPWRNGKLEE